MAKSSFWEEFTHSEDAPILIDSVEEYEALLAKEKERKRKERANDPDNEVGVIPDPAPEVLADRERYINDYTLVHEELFSNSTGLKPLSEAQKNAVRHSQFFIQHRSNILKCEPRGFGKTSRSTNEGLMGVLQGFIPYLVIVGSNTEKAEEIVSSIMAELFSNDKLMRLYPRPIACFRKTEKEPRKSLSQTYNGEPTYLYYNNGFIVFPHIEGEPSSGAIIDIRARKNVRGIYHTIATGERAGTRQRPTHVILDDIQTDEEAENPKTATKIIRLIKRSIMMAGGHDSSLAIMMNATPIAPGDVTHHFLFNEPWPHIIYKMLESRSEREDLWFGRYQELLQDFDKTVPGAKIAAAQRALEFYRENFEEMNKGAKAAWEWCYKWNEQIQTEIHAVQHAYNIMIIEGMDVFEAECQCNVSAADIDETITYCSAEDVAASQSPRPRNQPQVTDRHVVSHIDVNLSFLTYATVSSPDILQASIIDYGTWPEYQAIPDKNRAPYTILDTYKKQTGHHDLLPEDAMYMAVKDLVTRLSNKRYKREDGVEFPNHKIIVDSRYMQDSVYRAIRDSKCPNVYPAQGMSYKAKDKPLALQKFGDAAQKFHHCVLIPAGDKMLLRLSIHDNNFKTQAHLLFSREANTTGSAVIFKEEKYRQHMVVGMHFNAELPFIDIDPKTGYQLTVWELRPGSVDNEFFDNFVGCLAALAMCRVDFSMKSANQIKKIDIKEYLLQQKNRK